MSTSTTPFFVPDTSPLYAYSPCVNCASAGSWQSAYAPLGDGYDQTFHQTTGSGTGASVSLNISASSLGVETVGGCGVVSVQLNGSAYGTACAAALEALPKGMHEVVVRPSGNATTLQFLGISGKARLSSPSKLSNTTFDDLSPSFVYSPDWTHLHAAGPTGSAANSSLVAKYTRTGAFYNNSLSVATRPGARAGLTFRAEAIYLFGMSGPDGGLAQISLDGVVTNTANFSNAWTAYSSLLYMGSGLNASQSHTLSVVSSSSGEVVLDYAVLSNLASSSSSYSHLALIIGAIAGTSAILLIIGVITYIILVGRRSPRGSQGPYPFGGHAYNTTSPKGTTIDTWRKQASSYSSISPSADVSHYPYQAGLVGRPFPVAPGDRPTTGKNQISPRNDGSYLSPSADYPEYIAYRGPVEMNQPASPATATGGSSAAATWLQAEAAFPPLFHQEFERGQNGESLGSRRSIARLSSLPAENRRSVYQDETALDRYYGPNDTQSPLSTPSSLGLVGVTSRAVGATRTVARLWPNNDSSIYVSSGPESYAPSSFPTSVPPAAQRDRACYIPTMTSAGNLAPNTHLQILSSPRSDLVANSHSSSTPHTLRRGVSIKSVKTMRSFFSSLLHGSSSPRPQTPALLQSAARPDSDIFPPAHSRQASESGYPKSVTVPSRAASRVPRGLRLDPDEGRKDWIIELDLHSPMTLTSRPASAGARAGRLGSLSWI